MGYKGRAILVFIAIINIIICCLIIDQLKVVHMVYLLGGLVIAWILGHRFDEVQYTSETDALTGVRNRWRAQKLFDRQRRRAERRSKILAAFIIDIDDFKGINDMHDHQTGDIVLKLITHLLIELFGSDDYIMRWGGDEFIVLHLFQNDVQLDAMYQTLHDEVMLLADKVSFALSVSVGYSIYPRDGTEFEQLIDIADKKMYSNKLSRA